MLHDAILTLTSLNGPEAPPPPKMAAILAAVSKVRDIPVTELRSPRRNRRLAEARWLFWWFCVEYTEQSYPQIARFVNKDHSSVYNGAMKVRTSMAEYADDINSVNILVNGGTLPIKRPRGLFPYVGQHEVPFQ